MRDPAATRRTIDTVRPLHRPLSIRSSHNTCNVLFSVHPTLNTCNKCCTAVHQAAHVKMTFLINIELIHLRKHTHMANAFQEPFFSSLSHLLLLTDTSASTQTRPHPHTFTPTSREGERDGGGGVEDQRRHTGD